MIRHRFPSPGSDFVSGSVADYLGLLMEGQQLSFCTLGEAPTMPGWSRAHQIYFKDTQPEKEGWELSTLPAPDQPNTKYSSCKLRQLFKVVDQHCGRTGAQRLPLMPAGKDGVTERKRVRIFPASLLKRFTSSQQPPVSLFHRCQRDI